MPMPRFRVTCILGISGFGGISQLRAFRLNPMGFEGFGILFGSMLGILGGHMWRISGEMLDGFSYCFGCFL